MTNLGLDSGLVIAILIGVAVLYLGLVMVRGRRLLGRPGGVPLALRVEDENWRLGVGRYAGDALLWYGAFRPTRRPTRELRRADLEVMGQRRRRSSEPMLTEGSVVVECRSPDAKISLALSEAAVTGFLSWLEAAPPRS